MVIANKSKMTIKSEIINEKLEKLNVQLFRVDETKVRHHDKTCMDEALKVFTAFSNTLKNIGYAFSMVHDGPGKFKVTLVQQR